VNHHIRHRLSADARRDTIIDAAIRLFSEKGFKGTTTRELSTAVGVTEPVLYEHFRTKHELYEAMMDRMAEEGMSTFRAMLDTPASAEPREFVRALAHAVFGWFARHPAFIRLLLFSALEGEEISRRFHGRATARIVDAMACYAKSNAAKLRMDFDATVAAHALYCMLVQHGLTYVLFPEEDSRDHRERLDRMVEVLVGGISK
jgi:AcrR family transcriptional regulator